MGANGGNGCDSVHAIAVRRFRHTLFFPLALAWETDQGGDQRSTSGKRVQALADELAQSSDKPWREIKNLVTHCETPADVPADEDLEAERYQETVFFHRFIQRVLYSDDLRGHGAASDGDDLKRHAAAGNASGRSMRIFRREDLTGVTVEICAVDPLSDFKQMKACEWWEGETKAGHRPSVGSIGRLSIREVNLKLEAVNLYLFEAGVAILTLTVSLACMPNGMLENSVKENGCERAATVADILDLTEQFRRLYIPYWIKSAVGEPEALRLHVWPDGVPAAVTWRHSSGKAFRLAAPPREEVTKAFVADFSHGVPALLPWWKELLPERLRICGTSKEQAEWRFVTDERMATSSFLSIKDINRLSPGTWSRLCFCDKAGDKPNYGEGFLTDFDAHYAYDRFRSWGTRYVMCSYNFVCVVSEGRSPDFIELHMRRHYFQVFLLAQFQAAALLAFSNWVSEAMKSYADDADDDDEAARRRLRNDLYAIERDFQAFVHRYWFTGVSNQVQPSEIYSKLRELLSLETWFREVMTEIETSRAFLRDQEQERTARSAESLSLLAGLGLLIVVPAAILGMNFTFGDKEWLAGLLSTASVQRLVPGATSCGELSKVAAQLAWTMFWVALCAGALLIAVRQPTQYDDHAPSLLRRTAAQVGRIAGIAAIVLGIVALISWGTAGPCS